MNTALTKDIHWVGYVDWGLREFHSFAARRGATYNSYLILDEKVALIDGVKAPYARELLDHIRARVPPEKINYIVCNHAEPDHSGALPALLAGCPRATVLCGRMTQEVLGKYYDTAAWRFERAHSSTPISLGRHTLRFVETPLLHWPDSIFTYVPEAELLFSMDAFGQLYASNRRFDDEVNLAEVLEEAKTYYANIVMPFGRQVLDNLKKLSGLKVSLLAPSHGVVWRRHIAEIVSRYQEWGAFRPRPKVLIVYDTMWGSTEAMAEAVAEGASLPGVEVKLSSLRRTDLTWFATEALDAAAIAVGSATLNQGMLPAVAAALSYLEGLKPRHKAAFAFGSSGWAKGGADGVEARLKAMGLEVLRPALFASYAPTRAVLDECRAAGQALGQRALPQTQ